MTTLAQKAFSLNSVETHDNLALTIKALIANAGTIGIVAVAPLVAKRITEELNFSGQRNVKKARVNENVNLMRSGAWEPHISILVFCELPDGTLVLINGQHRCHAIVEMGVPINTKIDIIPARDQEHVRSLYAKYDARSSVRTETELVKASGIAEALAIKTRTAEILIKAVPVILNGMEPSTRMGGKEHMNQFSFRVEQAASWAREASEFDVIAGMAEQHIRRNLMRAGTMAVALYTLRHSTERAIEFWSGVARNDGLRKTDPRARLIADFSIRTLASGSMRQSVQQSVIAWNAFYEGRELKVIKCIEGSDIVISGTPMRKGGKK